MEVVKSYNTRGKGRPRGKVDINKVMLKRIHKVNQNRFTVDEINKMLDKVGDRERLEWVKLYHKPAQPERARDEFERLDDETLNKLAELVTEKARRAHG